MSRSNPINYATAVELFARAAELETEAALLSGLKRQIALTKSAQLRLYENFKQWAPPIFENTTSKDEL